MVVSFGTSPIQSISELGRQKADESGYPVCCADIVCGTQASDVTRTIIGLVWVRLWIWVPNETCPDRTNVPRVFCSKPARLPASIWVPDSRGIRNRTSFARGVRTLHVKQDMTDMTWPRPKTNTACRNETGVSIGIRTPHPLIGLSAVWFDCWLMELVDFAADCLWLSRLRCYLGLRAAPGSRFWIQSQGGGRCPEIIAGNSGARSSSLFDDDWCW